MAIFTYQSLADWQKELEKNPALTGPSPGGAAAYLGVSRQAIHNAVKRGKLDAVRVLEGGKLLFLDITNESLQRYMENPSTDGRPPTIKGRLAMAKDQIRHAVWE